jgi:hypothetical protein
MLRVVRMLAVVGAVGLLAACTSGSGYSDLDRGATSADVLPSDLPSDAADEFIEGSLRHLGERDGADYYLALADEFAGACITVYRSADEWDAVGKNVVVRDWP